MPESTHTSPSEEARAIVQAILDSMGAALSCEVVEDADERIVIDMRGEDAGLVIGRQGEALAALQLIASVIFHRKTGLGTRLILDAEGYRERRTEGLKEQALRVAASVKSSGREAVLESLRPFERRIVHLALADDPDVFTYSEGEGDDRALVISPRD